MKELFKILEMDDAPLGVYLRKELKKHYKKVFSDGDNYLYVKGTSPVCLVAHIDTVRAKLDSPVVLACNHNVIRNTKGILGADDRAGVYGILEVMRELATAEMPLPSIIFTNYEERGGKGVKAFIKDKKFDPRGIDLLLELDRKGCNEYVFYSNTLPGPVKDYVESFGFREERGSYSDISDLTDEYHIPSVNLSIGYYAQHSFKETLHYDEMCLTIDRVVEMCNEPIGKLYPVPKPLYGKYRGAGGGFDDYEGYYGSYYSGKGQTFQNGKLVTTPAKTTTPAAPVTTSTITSAAANQEKVANALVAVGGAEVQKSLNFAQDIAFTVATELFDIKAEIMSELTTVYTLDTIADGFLSHEFRIEVIEKLDELQEMFINLHNSDIKGVRAFHITWNKIIMEPLWKLQAQRGKA